VWNFIHSSLNRAKYASAFSAAANGSEQNGKIQNDSAKAKLRRMSRDYHPSQQASTEYAVQPLPHIDAPIEILIA
jgi:hypothetical protein